MKNQMNTIVTLLTLSGTLFLLGCEQPKGESTGEVETLTTETATATTESSQADAKQDEPKAEKPKIPAPTQFGFRSSDHPRNSLGDGTVPTYV